MPQDVMKDNRQQKWTLVILQGHPFGREHHTCTAIDLNNMMVIVDEFLGLLARTNADSLIGVDSIKVRWTGHANASTFAIQVTFLMMVGMPENIVLGMENNALDKTGDMKTKFRS
jgi:hypothetical protein